VGQRMKRIFALVVLTIGLLLLVPAQIVLAAGGKPSIVIVSPHPGAVIHGSTITLKVAVRNFRLVPPVWKNPPVLQGKAGNIEYQLDGPATFNPTYDITASTTHRWMHVRPGRHTLMAFLATSQHVPYPSAPSVHLQVTLAPAAPPQRPAGGATSPGVTRGPSTGGAADMVHNPLNYSLLLAVGLAILVLGLALFSRRFAFAGTRGVKTSTTPTRAPASVQPLQAARESTPEPAPISEVQSSAVPSGGAPDEVEQPEPALDLPAPLPGVAGPEPAPAVAVDPAQQLSPMPAPLPQPSTEREAERPAEVNPTPTTPFHTPEAAPLADTGPLRDRAVEMAQQWSQVVENLVRQLDEQEAERRRMLEHIRLLEQRLQSTQGVREQLQGAASGMLSPDDLRAVRYVADSLLRDPDHIVVLAAVAQNAGKLHDLVESYARLREAIDQL
jgi:hypothetical protein